MTRFDFDGKTALITGSSRGIGAAILKGFAGAGAAVVLHYFPDPGGANKADAERLAESLRAESRAVHLAAADVRSPEAVEAMMDQVAAAVGKIDVLVNNAGILRDKSLRKMEVADWRDVLGTNLDGTFHCCKYAAELINDGGRIVNVASISGVVGMHGQANYAASKAGVMALTRVLAQELARRRITVNALAPGLVNTAILDPVKPEVRQRYIDQIPLGRLAEPEDIAHAALFLASEEAGYITGQVLPVTGGWH